MILTCPACATRYEVDGKKFPSAGRTVRCAKCGHTWHQAAPEPEPEPALEPDALFVEETPPPPPEPVGEPEPEPVEPAPPQPEAYAEPAEEPASAPEPEPVFPHHREPDLPDDIVAPPPPEPAPKPRTSPLAWMGVGFGWLALIGVVLAIGWAAVTYREAVVAHWPQSASLYAKLGFKSPIEGLSIENLAKVESYQDGQSMLKVTGTVVNRGAAEMAVPQIRASLSSGDHRELYHWTFSPAVLTLKPGQSTRFTTRVSSPPPAARHLDMRFVRAGE